LLDADVEAHVDRPIPHNLIRNLETLWHLTLSQHFMIGLVLLLLPLAVAIYEAEPFKQLAVHVLIAVLVLWLAIVCTASGLRYV
jgi:hypothetical protein